MYTSTPPQEAGMAKYTTRKVSEDARRETLRRREVRRQKYGK
jgi:hypothetical protein